MTIFGRLIHDKQDPDYSFAPRSRSPKWNGRPHPPETAVYSNVPRKSKHGFKFTDLFKEFTRKLNYHWFYRDHVYKALLKGETGWINGGDGIDSVTFRGNVVEIELIQDGWARVKAQSFSGIPVPGITYFTHPQYIHKFNAVKKTSGFIKLANGYDAYIPFLKNNEAWFPLEKIELFPDLPFAAVVNVSSLKVRQSPDQLSIFDRGLVRGEIVTITEYAVRGGNVWGKISDTGEWINLQLQTGSRIEFFTNWKMVTEPPI